MRVLFVYRGYGKYLLNSKVELQRKSLINDEIKIDNFCLGKGNLSGYFSAIKNIRITLKENDYDLIHAHYSFSGFAARLSTKKPVICSLMGSDIFGKGWLLGSITKIFYKFLWKFTIVKSKEMQRKFPNAKIVPNGVNFSKFKPINPVDAIKITNFKNSNRNIIFVANSPKAKVKNLFLAKRSIEILNDSNVKFHIVSQKSIDELPFYYNAADVLLLTSLSEGSPNVIKEAMACNCPIVATNVGDVREVISDTIGCYITSFEPHDVADKLKMALEFNGRTNGREKISNLSSEVIAKKIISIYKEVSKNY